MKNHIMKTTSSGTSRKKQISSNNKLIKLFATTGLLAGFVGTSVSAATIAGTATYTGYSGQATSAAPLREASILDIPAHLFL